VLSKVLTWFMCAANTLNVGSAPDCYAVVSLHEARIAHTHIDRRTNHPRWGERFIVPVAHDVDALTVKVKDKDMVGSNFMGQVSSTLWLVTILVGVAEIAWRTLRLYFGQAESTLGHLLT